MAIGQLAGRWTAGGDREKEPFEARAKKCYIVLDDSTLEALEQAIGTLVA